MRSIFTPGERNYERSLDDLGLPVRIVNAANARGLYTLREFLSLPPAAFTTERNIGRKTLSETERAILRTLGSSWQDAWSKLKGPATRTSLPPPAPGPREGETAPARWARLALYPRLASLTVVELPLPTRMKNHAAREHIVSAADLVTRSWASLLQTDQLGCGTMHKSLEVLEAALVTASLPDPLVTSEHWRAAMSLCLAELEGDLRPILTRRAGLAGELPTLAQLGEELGVSRERIRQKEERAKERIRTRLARMPFRDRLAALVRDPLTLVTDLDDPFFAVDPEDEPAYALFVDVLDSGIRLTRLDDRLFLTRLGETEARALWAQVEETPLRLTYPLAHTRLDAHFAETMPCTEEQATRFVRLLGSRFLCHGGEVRGYGTRREDGVLAYLRAQPGPVHRSELETHLGRGAWPDDVVLIDRGMLTLRERVPGWQAWVERAGQLVARTMKEQAPDRHWTTYELVPVLAEQAEVPTWFNAWSLGALLKESEHTQYLGRNVVALAGEPEVRTYLVDAVRSILERAGGPMPEREVHDAILQTRGLTETTWALLRLRAPFVLLGDVQLGIAPRDVPGGATALEAAVRAIASALHEEQIGWDRHEVERFFRDLGAPWSAWGSRLARSVLRLSGMFRLTRAGGVGLAEWSDARVPLRMPHEAPRLREPTSAEVRASLLERWLISLPERAAPIARELVKEDHPALEEDLRGWEDKLLATMHPALEPTQVARLVQLAHELHAGDFGRRLGPLVRAALAYVCMAAEARTEPMIGMLDDDETVLVATRDLCVARA